MTESVGGTKFPELFEVIRAYSEGDLDHQEKALRLVDLAYEGAPEVEAMPGPREAIDVLLSQHGYVFPLGGVGNLDPRSVDAVVRIALYEEGNRE